MLEQLFGSKTRVKLLRIFFRDQDKAYFVRELTRLIEAQINAVRREIELLVKIGLIACVDVVPAKDDISISAGLRKYYRLEKTSMLYPELQALLLKEQVMEEQEFIKDIKEKGGELKLVLLTGRFTNDLRAPSDVLMVGNVNDKSVARLIAHYEQELGFDIRYTIMSEKEFYDRRHIMDKFLYSLFEANCLKVVNVLGV